VALQPGDLAGQGQQERDRVVRDLVGPVVRNVHHRDAVVGRRREVDAVHADAVPDQHANPRKPLQHAPSDRAVLDQQSVRVAAPLEILGVRARDDGLESHARPPEDLLLLREVHVVQTADDDERRLWHRGRHEGERIKRCTA
jgi:hypothetical protein